MERDPCCHTNFGKDEITVGGELSCNLINIWMLIICHTQWRTQDFSGILFRHICRKNCMEMKTILAERGNLT